jgi:hypothetical protein
VGTQKNLFAETYGTYKVLPLIGRGNHGSVLMEVVEIQEDYLYAKSDGTAYRSCGATGRQSFQSRFLPGLNLAQHRLNLG